MGFLGAGAARQRDDPGAFFQPGSDFIIFGQLGERLEEHLHTIPLCIFMRSFIFRETMYLGRESGSSSVRTDSHSIFSEIMYCEQESGSSVRTYSYSIFSEIMYRGRFWIPS